MVGVVRIRIIVDASLDTGILRRSGTGIPSCGSWYMVILRSGYGNSLRLIWISEFWSETHWCGGVRILKQLLILIRAFKDLNLNPDPALDKKSLKQTKWEKKYNLCTSSQLELKDKGSISALLYMVFTVYTELGARDNFRDNVIMLGSQNVFAFSHCRLLFFSNIVACCVVAKTCCC